jgi:hypothetical protein
MDVRPSYFSERDHRKLSVDTSELGEVFDSEEGALLGRFRFEVVGRTKRRKSLSIWAEYIVIYEVATDVDDSAAKAFCKRVGLFAAYPYFRALVAHLSAEANASLPPVPVIATRGASVRALEPQARREAIPQK